MRAFEIRKWPDEYITKPRSAAYLRNQLFETINTLQQNYLKRQITRLAMLTKVQQALWDTDYFLSKVEHVKSIKHLPILGFYLCRATEGIRGSRKEKDKINERIL